MKTLWLESKSTYTGEELRPLTNYLKHGLLGNSMVAWLGPCSVATEHMIDGEDLRAGATIAADEMVHFVLELFDFPLKGGVVLQRLMAETALDVLKEMNLSTEKLIAFNRRGDDLYLNRQKFNISIATVSSNSVLVHFAVNSRNTGAPVPIISLQDLDIHAKPFAEKMLQKVSAEFIDIIEASQKIRSF